MKPGLDTIRRTSPRAAWLAAKLACLLRRTLARRGVAGGWPAQDGRAAQRSDMNGIPDGQLRDAPCGPRTAEDTLLSRLSPRDRGMLFDALKDILAQPGCRGQPPIGPGGGEGARGYRSAATDPSSPAT